MPWSVVVITALLAGLAALPLTGWLRSLAGADSRWLALRVHVPLAMLGGAGAAVLAVDRVELIAYALTALAFGLLIVVDLTALKLPDPIVGPALLALVGLLAIDAGLGHEWGRLGRALLGGLVLTAGYFILAVISPDNLGLGDVKLASVLGVLLGWQSWSAVLYGGLAGFVLSAAVSVVLLVSRRANLKTAFPFGPLMIAGAVLGLL